MVRTWSQVRFCRGNQSSQFGVVVAATRERIDRGHGGWSSDDQTRGQGPRQRASDLARDARFLRVIESSDNLVLEPDGTAPRKNGRYPHFLRSWPVRTKPFVVLGRNHFCRMCRGNNRVAPQPFAQTHPGLRPRPQISFFATKQNRENL